MIDKIAASVAEALAGVKDGATVLIGGFGTAVHVKDASRFALDDCDAVRAALRAPEPRLSGLPLGGTIEHALQGSGSSGPHRGTLRA